MNQAFSTRRRRAIFAVAAAGYLLSHFYRTFLTILAEDLERDLAIGPAEFGAIGGLWFLAFALAQFPVGVALDRIGPRRTIGVTMGFAVIGALGFALSSRPIEAQVAMVLTGIGCSPILMGTLYFLARTETPARFASLGSLFFACGILGSLVSSAPLALLVEALGWRGAIGLTAGVTALIAMLILLVFRDPPPAPAGPAGSLVGDMLTLLRQPSFWPILVMSLAATAPVAAERSLWVAPYFADMHGLDRVARGNAVLVFAFTTALSAMIAGPLAGTGLGPKRIVLAANALSGSGFLMLALWPAPPLAPALAAYGLIGIFSGTYTVLLAHARGFMPAHVIGRGITFINFLAIGNAGVTQWLSGLRVEALRANGLAPAALYADLHLIFGLMLLVCSASYALAPSEAPSQRAGVG